MNVDLPDPFWPSRPWISPGKTSRSRSRRTVRPENVFENPRAERTGCGVVAFTGPCGRAGGLVLPGRDRFLLHAPQLLVLSRVVVVPVPGRLLRGQVDRVDVVLREQAILDADV